MRAGSHAVDLYGVMTRRRAGYPCDEDGNARKFTMKRDVSA